ncbi:hypothetical protein SNEBB_002835 [Seison nebaliae]|nr:hypothetical protein SNEBB_002835 [Seison nebaliae]
MDYYNNDPSEDENRQENYGKIEAVGIKFCPECANMLYPKEHKESRILLYKCRSCPHQEKAESCCIYRSEFSHDRDGITQIVAEVTQDPTLPKSRDYTCPSCETNHCVYFQGHASKNEDKMTLYFVCINCSHRWTE